MKDDPNLDEYNVNKKVDAFLNITLNERTGYMTDNLIMTMGSDFQYSNAHLWFKNLDKLIYYVNQRQYSGSKVNIFYSTPSCYLYSLYKTNQSWPIKTDDFFPYAHRPHAFWTGYFTSRATLKDYVRRTNNFLQVVRQLSATADLNDDSTRDSLAILTRAMGVAQHHDGVSGTERQHVANDYAKRLSIGTEKCEPILQNAQIKLIYKKYNKDFGNTTLKQYYCPLLLNISECLPIEDAKNFSIAIYNPLAQSVSSWIRVPVTLPDYRVYELNTKQYIESDFIEIYNETKMIPGRKSNANNVVLFKATIPPLGFSNYILSTKEDRRTQIKTKETKLFDDDIVLKNKFLVAQFDKNGNLIKIDNIETRISIMISQELCIYDSMPGNNSEPEFQASGAYVFRPNGDPTCLHVQKFKINQGKQFIEIHQTFNEWISQTIQLFDDSQELLFSWIVGPIDVSNGIGKEVVTRFNTDLSTKATFYTDANGREILKRVRDYRPTWDLKITEPVAGNYYPINSKIYIRDEIDDSNGRQLTLCTDRTQGGASITDGSIEIMLHRRVLYDDALGVSEPLNEPGFENKGLVVAGNIYLLLDTIKNSAKLHRSLAHKINTQPLITFGILQNDLHYDQVNFLSGLSTVSGSLPENLHLLTLMKDFESDNALIIRLEHFYELNEDPILSQPATIDLAEFLKPSFKLVAMTELALGANMDVAELDKRLIFSQSNDKKFIKPKSEDLFKVTLVPMQIRTFRAWYLPQI